MQLKTNAEYLYQAVVNEDASGDVKVLRAQIQQMKVSVELFTIPAVHAHVYNIAFASLLVCNYALLIRLDL